VRELVVSAIAETEIADILAFSAKHHGAEAARRYLILPEQGIFDVLDEPDRPTSKPAEIGDLRLYPLRLAIRRLARADKVSTSPHLIVYRYDDAMVEIAHVLHAAMDLPHHLASDGA